MRAKFGWQHVLVMPTPHNVIPAQAGISGRVRNAQTEMQAFASMTMGGVAQAGVSVSPQRHSGAGRSLPEGVQCSDGDTGLRQYDVGWV